MKNFPFKLFFALLFLTSVPTVYGVVRTSIVSNTNPNSFSILGHIEWFDLFHEIIFIFCTVPLYHLFKKHKDKFSLVVRSVLFSFAIIYLIYTTFIFLNINNILSFMNVTSNLSDVSSYLRIETFSLLLSFLSAIILIVLLVVGKEFIFYLLLITKTIFFVLSDFFFIPHFDFLGVAYSNILVELIILTITLLYCHIQLKLFSERTISFFWLKEIFFKGGFAGGQIFLDNFMYGLVVMQMINQLNTQGDYWLANNFIWGILLIPCFALSEIIKSESLNKKNDIPYFIIASFIVLIWSITLPLWDNFFQYFYGFNEQTTEKVLSIVFSLLPFYIFYLFSSIISSKFISIGKTHILFLVSLFVNCLYYPLVLFLLNKGIFEVNINFVVNLFGIGILINLILSSIFYFFLKKKEIVLKI